MCCEIRWEISGFFNQDLSSFTRAIGVGKLFILSEDVDCKALLSRDMLPLKYKDVISIRRER